MLNEWTNEWIHKQINPNSGQSRGPQVTKKPAPSKYQFTQSSIQQPAYLPISCEVKYVTSTMWKPAGRIHHMRMSSLLRDQHHEGDSIKLFYTNTISCLSFRPPSLSLFVPDVPFSWDPFPKAHTAHTFSLSSAQLRLLREALPDLPVWYSFANLTPPLALSIIPACLSIFKVVMMSEVKRVYLVLVALS